MSWKKEVEELRRREELARQMGGPEGIARQHKRGKLTVRERIDLFADPGSFSEFAGLVGSAIYEGDELMAFRPSAQVDGMCRVDGRKVVVTGSDFTVRGGSGTGTSNSLGAELPSNRRALEWRLPYVRLLDSAGGSVRGFEEMQRTYLPDGNDWFQHDVKLLNLVPVVSAVLGSVAGGPAIMAPLSHWSVMTQGTAHLFPGGPPVVKAALGYEVSKEELGGAEIHVRESGVIDNPAETEADALRQIRRFLSYLPQNVYEMAPHSASSDFPARREEELLSIVPREQRRPYNMHHLIDLVVDEESFFEVAPLFGRGRITGLARIGGYPVGVIANNPMQLGGSTDVAGGEKVIRMIKLCDTFNLPIVSFADEPGAMVGTDSERQGIERAAARLLCATCDSRMPWITIVVRQLFGMAGTCQHRPTGMFRRYAWPSARWGSMHIQGGAAAAYRREIESAPDPEQKRREIEERLDALASPFRTAEATGQDIIDPRDTRPLVAEFVEDAQPILASQLGPASIPYRP